MATEPAPLPAHPPGIEPLPVWVPPSATTTEVLAGGAAGAAMALARPLLSSPVLAAFRPLRPTGIAAAQRGAVAAGGDPGWFGPDSVAWRVHADASMFVAGVAAFAYQSLHPLALAGVADHGSFAEDFAGRTRRTAEFVQGVVFGSTSEALSRCATVRGVHRRVVGSAPDGRRYDANDPELLEWVHCSEYLAIAAASRRFGAFPLSDEDLDRYVAEVAIVGEHVGVRAPPRSWAELDAALQRFRPALAVGEQAAGAIRFLQQPPGLPASVRPAWRVAWAGAVACLPPSARRLLRVPEPSRAELIACRGLMRALSQLLGPPPPLVAARARLGLAVGN